MAGVFNPGDLIRVKKLRHFVAGDGPVEFIDVDVKSDRVYVLLYLGAEMLDESVSLNVKDVLRELLETADWDATGLASLHSIPRKENPMPEKIAAVLSPIQRAGVRRVDDAYREMGL